MHKKFIEEFGAGIGSCTLFAFLPDYSSRASFNVYLSPGLEVSHLGPQKRHPAPNACQ